MTTYKVKVYTMNNMKKTIECDPLGTPQVRDEDKRWLIGHRIEKIENYNINYESFFNYDKECNEEYFTSKEKVREYINNIISKHSY